MLINYGGHKQAIGMKISIKRIGKFRNKINDYAKDKLKPSDLIPKIKVDALLSFEDINLNLVKEIDSLSPFGVGNPSPKICSLNLKLEDDPFILKERHIKLRLGNNLKVLECIGFEMISFFDEIMKNIDKINIVYSPEINVWNGVEQIILNLKDIKGGKIEI